MHAPRITCCNLKQLFGVSALDRRCGIDKLALRVRTLANAIFIPRPDNIYISKPRDSFPQHRSRLSLSLVYEDGNWVSELFSPSILFTPL
jgi:hypothetical protein